MKLLIVKDHYIFFSNKEFTLTKPIEVIVNNDIERALKELKKKMAFEGIFKELKKRRYYEKPSQEKKRKREETVRRLIKKQRRMMFKSRNR